MLPELHLWSTKTSCSCSCSLKGYLISRDINIFSSETVHCESRNPSPVPLQVWDKAALKRPSKWTSTVKILHFAHVLDSSHFVFAVLWNTCVQPPREALKDRRGQKHFLSAKMGRQKSQHSVMPPLFLTASIALTGQWLFRWVWLWP